VVLGVGVLVMGGSFPDEPRVLRQR
jgi:hypothetical protein